MTTPKHYAHGKIEPIDVIEDWKLGFNLGNVIKYIARAEHKGYHLKDLKKALYYLQREVSCVEVSQIDEETQTITVNGETYKLNRDGSFRS